MHRGKIIYLIEFDHNSLVLERILKEKTKVLLEINIKSGSIKFGKNEINEVKLNDESVNDFHCEISLDLAN